MARQRRSAAPARSAPSRPTAAPARSAAPQTQQRQSSTAAAPPAQAQQAPPPAAAQSGGSGLFGQMASTAAGVAVGSSIGHAVGGWFSGGSSAPAEPQQAAAAQPMDNGMYQSNASSGMAENTGACETDVKAFRRCMDDNSGNMSICGWYLDQLKACQEAAKPY